MPNLVLAIHERIGNWSRHLRPRLVGWPLRLVETRSGNDLEQTLRGTVCPLVLIDVDRRPGPALEDLDRALTVAPDALALVLNPHALDGVTGLARELGATLGLDGPTPPPAVAGWLARWIPLAQKRSETAGRALSAPTPAEPWGWLAPYLGGRSGSGWTPGP